MNNACTFVSVNIFPCNNLMIKALLSLDFGEAGFIVETYKL